MEPAAAIGLRAAIQKATRGLVSFGPGRRERTLRQDVALVGRDFGGLRQVTVANPKSGAGKTVASLLLAMTFGQHRGGQVLAWDTDVWTGRPPGAARGNQRSIGRARAAAALGARAHPDSHSRTVTDLRRDLRILAGAYQRVGGLSQYVRAQPDGGFDVLAAGEPDGPGGALTAAAFGELRELMSRFYQVVVVDTGDNVRAPNWQAAIDATDQLVVTVSALDGSAETAARMLDHLESTGRQRLVRQAVTVVMMPFNRRDLDIPAIRRHFSALTREVLLAPYEPVLDTGGPVPYANLSPATRTAWLRIAAAVAAGL
jgi:MinD-like ATPase involved in chromosome partitioning or flagellar assembly